MLYVIQATTGPLKIGRADNPISRLKELQTSNPYGLVLCAELKRRENDDATFERHVHHRLVEYRLSGEWFDNAATCCNMVYDIFVGNGGRIWVPIVPKATKVDVLARLSRIETAISKLTQAQEANVASKVAATSSAIPMGIGILRKPQVVAATGRSYASIRRDMARRQFPQPVQIGPRAIGWRSDEVRTWLTDRGRGQLRGCPITTSHCQRACAGADCALEALKRPASMGNLEPTDGELGNRPNVSR